MGAMRCGERQIGISHALDVRDERPVLADSVEKVGFGFHGRKVRV